MRRRKEGFSLVELLIVLAVIAALIATITPVALNAIRKAKASKVAQNLKTLASSFENYVYVNGSPPDAITDLGRDIADAYAVYYQENSGFYTVTVSASEDVDLETVQESLLTATDAGASSSSNKLGNASEENIYYNFEFQVY